MQVDKIEVYRFIHGESHWVLKLRKAFGRLEDFTPELKNDEPLPESPRAVYVRITVCNTFLADDPARLLQYARKVTEDAVAKYRNASVEQRAVADSVYDASIHLLNTLIDFCSWFSKRSAQ